MNQMRLLNLLLVAAMLLSTSAFPLPSSRAAALPVSQPSSSEAAVVLPASALSVPQDDSLTGVNHTVSNAPVPGIDEAPSSSSRVERDWGQLPLYFVENQGQMDERVDYYIQGSDKTLYFTSDGITFALTKQVSNTDRRRFGGEYHDDLESEVSHQQSEFRRWSVKLDFVGANPNVHPMAEGKTEAVISYFKGSPDEWKAGLPTYNRIVYHDLWPGIDLVYYGTVNQLKYEFIVQPGADPAQIRLAYRGATSVQVNAAGQLEVTTPAGGLRDGTPVAHQEIDGQRVPVSMAYEIVELESDSDIRNPKSYSFAVGPYDPSFPLVLDPALLIYAGYVGGSADDKGSAIAVDIAGNVYITGRTNSTEASFPINLGPDLTFNSGICYANPPYPGSPCFDAFVVKVNASGTALMYAGYIGGSGEDYGTGIAVDSLGNAYVVGVTGPNFPVFVGPDLTWNGGNDAFVAKVNSSGTALVYAGYIGGANTDRGYAIAVDYAGSAYITGRTPSNQSTFPVTVGPDLTLNSIEGDAFVAKVNASGTALVYAGYIGGSNYTEGLGIVVDATGNAYVTGQTVADQGFPVTVGPDSSYNGGGDAFIAKINATGTALIYAGFIGGANSDSGYAIAVDIAGNAYVTGVTASDQSTFPVVIGPDLTFNSSTPCSTHPYSRCYDAFVAKVNPTGSALTYAGYVGGLEDDIGRSIAVDNTGNAYITGETNSTEATFPVSIGPDLTYNGGTCGSSTSPRPCFDAFVAKVNVIGSSLEYAGYIGGSSDDYGRGIAADILGNAYIVGETQSTEGTFPVTVGPDLTYYGGTCSTTSQYDIHPCFDAFVAKVTISYTISGRVIDPSNTPISGTLILASFGLSATTNINGDYAIASALDHDTYVLTPTVTGCTTFTPVTRTVAISRPIVSGQDFVVVNIPYMFSQGNQYLDAGRLYRWDFHQDVSLTLGYTQTIAALKQQQSLIQFAEAETWYRRILTCEPTNALALSRLLDTRWEIATADLLSGNDQLVEAFDVKSATSGNPLPEEINQLTNAIDQFTQATTSYTDLLASEYYTTFMTLQPTRIDPLSPTGQVTPYLDIQRLAQASAQKSRAYVEKAERQFKMFTPEYKAAAEQTLRQGMSAAVSEAALLRTLWSDIANDASYQAILRNIADMQRLFRYLQTGKNPFGYDADHVPFNFLPSRPGNNYEQTMVLAQNKLNAASQLVEDAQGWLQQIENNYTQLQTDLHNTTTGYNNQLIQLCGSYNLQPDLENCHQNPAGEIYGQLLRIDAAWLRIDLVRQQMANQLALIDIEQQRAARVAGIQRATAKMFEENGEVLASLAKEETTLRSRANWSDYVNSVLSVYGQGLLSKGGNTNGTMQSVSRPNRPTGLWGAVALSVLSTAASHLSNSSAGRHLGELAAKRERLLAMQNAQVHYAEAQITDVNSEALIKQYMLRFAEYDLELNLAANNLQQELTRFNGLKAQADYLVAEKTKAIAFTIALFADPAARVTRDSKMELANDQLDVALRYAWQTGRALEYEINQDVGFQGLPLSNVDDLYRVRDPMTLLAALNQMSTAYDAFFQRDDVPAPQDREDVIYLSQALGFETTYDPDLGRVVTREEKFNAYVRDPAHRVDLSNPRDGIKESLQFTFQTSIFLRNRFFPTTVFNDKIKSVKMRIYGNGLGNDRAVIHLKQDGTTFIRTVDAFSTVDPFGNPIDDIRQYNVPPLKASIMAATNLNELPPDVAINKELASRSVACTNWTLTLPKFGEPNNNDVNIDNLEDIELKITHETYTLQNLARSYKDAAGRQHAIDLSLFEPPPNRPYQPIMPAFRLRLPFFHFPF